MNEEIPEGQVPLRKIKRIYSFEFDELYYNPDLDLFQSFLRNIHWYSVDREYITIKKGLQKKTYRYANLICSRTNNHKSWFRLNSNDWKKIMNNRMFVDWE